MTGHDGAAAPEGSSDRHFTDSSNSSQPRSSGGNADSVGGTELVRPRRRDPHMPRAIAPAPGFWAAHRTARKRVATREEILRGLLASCGAFSRRSFSLLAGVRTSPDPATA